MKYIDIINNKSVEIITFSEDGKRCLVEKDSGWKKLDRLNDEEHLIGKMGKEVWEGLDVNKKYWWEWCANIRFIKSCKVLRAMYGVEDE